MLFKSLLVSLVFLFTSVAGAQAPDKAQACQLEAVITQNGFAARTQLDKEEFEQKLKEFLVAVEKDPEVSKEQRDMAVRALRQGFAGVSPQKAFDACMLRKQT